jgi:hypothetical protein
MPYYVFKVQASVNAMVKNLDKIGEFEVFKEAKALVKDQRELNPASDNIEYRIMFATNLLEAEERLQEKRDADVVREWEK